MFCRNKKFCNTNLGQYWLSTRYFLGDFNEKIIIFSFQSTDVPSFGEKYTTIKYVISDNWRQLDLCETSFLLLNGSH
jgi:hypothetical protein